MTTMNVPAHIAARIAERKKNKTNTLASSIVGNQQGVSLPRISTRAGRFRLVEGGVESTVGTTLHVIVVGVNPKVSKVFYGRAFDQSAENQRPDCFSNDGVAPHSSVESPVCSNCASCPHNVLGSKVLPSGAKSKMCADQRHLAVVAAADPSKVYSLTIPVSGMKALREYFADLSNYGIGPEEVITELGFDDNASYPKLVFKQKDFITEKAIPVVENLLESDETKVAIRLLDPTANTTALAAPEQKAKLEAPKPNPEDDEASAYEEEPVVAKNTEKPKVEPVKASDELAAKLDSLFD